MYDNPLPPKNLGKVIKVVSQLMAYFIRLVDAQVPLQFAAIVAFHGRKVFIRSLPCNVEDRYWKAGYELITQPIQDRFIWMVFRLERPDDDEKDPLFAGDLKQGLPQ